MLKGESGNCAITFHYNLNLLNESIFVFSNVHLYHTHTHTHTHTTHTHTHTNGIFFAGNMMSMIASDKHVVRRSISIVQRKSDSISNRTLN